MWWIRRSNSQYYWQADEGSAKSFIMAAAVPFCHYHLVVCRCSTHRSHSNSKIYRKLIMIISNYLFTIVRISSRLLYIWYLPACLTMSNVLHFTSVHSASAVDRLEPPRRDQSTFCHYSTGERQ